MEERGTAGERPDETGARRSPRAHIADLGLILTDWALVAACTTLNDIGTGTTSYRIEGNDGQPVHVTTGLFHYATEHSIWDDDEDDDD